MNRFLAILLLCTPFYAIHYPVNAAPYTPQSSDEVIAHWPTTANDNFQSLKTASRLQPENPIAVTKLANAYLAQAAQPGQSRFYGLAQAALKPLIDKNITDTNLWLAWAQVQQHQHNFVVAQDAIAKVLEQDPTNINANLLAARIYVIQDKATAARNTCLKLLGTADLLSVTACSLEANSYLHPNDLKNTYQQLADMVKREGMPTDERANWIIQLLADLALRNQEPATAEEWLALRLTNASVNYLAQWANVQLALNNPQAVLAHLAPIVKSAPEMDDALLLRLALAEKKIGLQSQWQAQLTERVNLREQRQDSLHASDLAIYYLDISPNAEKAIFWAKTNFANTREYNDKNLLARAQQLNSDKEI